MRVRDFRLLSLAGSRRQAEMSQDICSVGCVLLKVATASVDHDAIVLITLEGDQIAWNRCLRT